MTDTPCPCGSGLTYAQCCRVFHAGMESAPTALQLMRSRYSGFAIGEASYLLLTWHPRTRPASLELNRAIEWRRLQITGVSAGGETDGEGTVEFVAHYWDAATRQYGSQHENSRFLRRGSRWFYVGPVG